MLTSGLSSLEEAPRPVRLWLVPVASTFAGSCLSLIPLVVTVPLLPPFGLLVALAWRLLRPEMWGAWVALPLGLADDLIGGAPLGSAMTLWTIAFLALDLADHYRAWRDALVDWQLGSIAIIFCVFGAWAIALFSGGAGPLWTALFQAGIAILGFPLVARVCSRLDRWRLSSGPGAVARD